MNFSRRLAVLSLGLALVCAVVIINGTVVQKWSGSTKSVNTVSENGEDVNGDRENGEAAERRKDTLVIDPGHGGIDGGAVGNGDVCEKDINLAIGLALKELAQADGWNVVMTRETDKGLYTGVDNDGTDEAKIQGKRSIRSLKTEDLAERKKIADEIMPAAYISIHLNSFKEDSRVHGAQTFFSSAGDETLVAEAKALAESIQAALVAGLDDGTNRVALGKKDVIILKNPKIPTVIIECGFLSNAEEAGKLQSSEYQKKVAQCIYEGICSGIAKPDTIKKIEVPIVITQEE